MVTLIRSDLEFILQQIQLSEAHATKEGANGQPVAGTALVDFTDPTNGLLPSPQLSFGLRTVDGSYNNLYPGQDGFGAADELFQRLLTPNYRPTVTLDPDGPGPAPGIPNSIIAPELRMISNLVVDLSSRNASAVVAAGIDYDPETAEIDFNLAKGADGILNDDPLTIGVNEAADNGIHIQNLFIGNSAPDEGLSAGFNSWMTLFGQFFDHGLDLVNKGGNGMVFVPLTPDDPLYDADSNTNFLVLTRATQTRLPGADGVLNTADDTFEHTNQTTPWVDQNQTYTSHSSHQVFLRAYEMVNGRPVATGELLDGANGGLPTWADIKQQASDLLGINLTDADVLNVPLLATDEYGRFLRGPNGYVQMVTTTGQLIEGNPAANGGLGVDVPANVARTGHAFIDDIAHNAAPLSSQGGAPLAADADNEINDHMLPRPAGTYDDELLDAHKITGDGRGNENIGLTAVHHIFHSEHNRMVEHTKEVVLATGDLVFINQWLDVPVGTVPTSAAGLDWNGERLFQAARFSTEMQYQHLVFEEFARKIQPLIGDFIFPIGYQADLNPAIFAEFAHAVYRFGHSMLTEDIDRLDPDFAASDLGLIDAFLNPVAFDANGTIDADVAAGAIVRGMTRQLGSEIDEFVTGAVRDNLLGLPLDLATINLARGRDTGIPSLNAARREIYDESGLTWMKPYDSWVDFAANLKNELSIVNFVAAYGLHPLITGQTTIEGKRDAALTIITGISVGGLAVPADAVAFLNSTGPWASNANGVTTTGLDNVDLWIGGLAEAIAPFGGMLGSTFNFIFEVQLEALQDGDRFYYLQRLHGLNFLNELENNSFAQLIMNNTDATHLPGDVFSTPGLILEVNQSRQFNLDENGVYTNADPTGGSILIPLIVRGPNSLRYTGDEHIVLGGTEANDTLVASIGDDTIWADGGDDQLEGGHGNDILHGGAGDDIITDVGGDDTIHGEEGNDVISAGAGLNLVLAGGGNDFIISGMDADSQSFGGRGNDFIIGGTPNGAPFGNEGDDWFEGGGQDGAAGDNEDPFGADPIKGHDVYHGDGGFDEFVAEGGDDIMHSSLGLNRFEAGSGFDWAAYHTVPLADTTGVYVDLLLEAFDEQPLPPTPETSIDRYNSTEAVSGSRGDDVIHGDDKGPVDPLDPEAELDPIHTFLLNELTQAGVDRVAGLRELLGSRAAASTGNPDAIAFTDGNILLGGAGSDRIMGRGGNDFIDGDHRLNVRISVRANPDGTGPELFSVNSARELIPDMLAGNINPGQLVIVREIVDESDNGDIDVAYFSDVQANYTITNNADGTITVAHTGGLQTDGVDTLQGIEQLVFNSGTAIPVGNQPTTGAPAIVIPTVLREGQVLQSNIAAIADADGIQNIALRWEVFNGTAWVPAAGAPNNAATYTPVQGDVGREIRLAATVTDVTGRVTVLNSAPSGGVIGDFFLGTGAADTFNGTTGSDRASGQAGNDLLNGGVGNDELMGNSGNDTLDGGIGADLMEGGLDSDVYIVDDALDVVTENANAGTDRIEASITYSLNTVGGANVENLTLTGAAAINGTGNGLANVITGNTAANILLGLAGNDTLNGGGGDDMLDGGIGTDTMAGGTGNDIYVVDSGNDVVTEAAGAGTDIVNASATFSLNTGGGANVENLTLTGTGNINGTGNGLANVITGNVGVNNLSGQGGDDTLLGGDGNDSLNGNDGNDTLDGQAGADTMAGGDGNDTYFVDNAGDVVTENGGAGTDTANASVTFSLNTNGGNVENLTLTGAANINGIGNGLANVVTGNAGVNNLSGQGGNDTLLGGAGNDSLNGNAGNDSLDGQDGDDTLDGGTGNDTLNVSVGNDIIDLVTNFGADTVIGFDSDAAGGQDRIDVSVFGVNAGNFAAQVGISQVGANTVISVGGGTITLQGVNAGTINATDFLFT